MIRLLYAGCGLRAVKKSIWIELTEWCVLALIALFLAAILWMRAEITSSDGFDATLQTLAE